MAMYHSTTSRAILTGRFLAHQKASLAMRAFEGADLVMGHAALVRPTIIQAAGLVRISPTSVHWALKRHALREGIEQGELPLVPPPSPRLALPVPDLNDDELAVVFNHIGVERVLEIAAAVENGNGHAVT